MAMRAPDATHLANRLPFGHASYVMTYDMRNASTLSEAIQGGSVIVNHWQASLPETPFGGYKENGIGRSAASKACRNFNPSNMRANSSLEVRCRGPSREFEETPCGSGTDCYTVPDRQD